LSTTYSDVVGGGREDDEDDDDEVVGVGFALIFI
jgi:hypothetical protein